ncbi:MAG: radical SAM protein [Eubacteriales bacterium]|nr:radical SAM protein [Eubacteriales bacterium]
MGAEDGRNDGRMIRQTESVCPVCLQKIKADIVAYEDEVYMEKTCEEHGFFQTLIWKGAPDYENWENQKLPSVQKNPAMQVEKGCPYDCGLCPEHRQHTCCVLLEVTNRCNLNCPVCFARAGEGDEVKEPSLAEIGEWYDSMMACGGPFNIQLSGGEPSVRDDLEDIIRLGKEKGFTFFQMNTNGIRLAKEPEYAVRLKAAGLSCVFLQFDGVRENAYEIFRGRKLLDVKKEAIKNCKKANLGVVLVPVIAKGVNEDQVGEILEFALEQMPAVRGVHFQPLSFFGRYEPGKEKDRFTLPQLLQAIEAQTDGKMKISNFTPAGAENAYCSFSGNFMKTEDGQLRPWNQSAGCGCGAPVEETPDAGEAAKKAQQFVARRWAASEEESCCCGEPEPAEESCCCCGEPKPAEENCCCGEEAYDTSSLDAFLKRVDQYTLAVSSMAFMDAWNLDLERLRDCYIHVVARKNNIRLIPFCAYNLTAADGTALYRE